MLGFFIYLRVSRLSRDEQEAILDYLSEFELYDVVEAGEKSMYCPAGLDNFDEERSLSNYDLSELLFHRPDYEARYYNKYLVTGHTPTRVAYATEQGVLWKNYRLKNIKI